MITANNDLAHPQYRPDIDGLRSFAVLSVVIYHAFPSVIQGGFVGVDVFFVISGFLISSIIFQSLNKNTFSFLVFYTRRINRIFPALLLILFASYYFGRLVLLADEYKQLGKHIATGAGFISNLALLREAGYFDNSAETKPLLHLWSLGIEEQFYIIWPLIAWTCWKKKFNFLSLLLLGIVFSFSISIWQTNNNATSAFYSPQTRFWELLSGSILAWIKSCNNNDKNFEHLKLRINYILVANLTSITGFIFLTSAIFFISSKLHFPGLWALLPVVGTVLIILSGQDAWINRVILSNRIAIWIGLISFPLYLWHWPLLTFARIIENGTPSHSIRIAAVLSSILLAWLTYKFLERPICASKNSKKVATLLLILMTTIGFAGFYTYKHDGITEYNLKYKYISDATNDWTYPIGLISKPDGLLSTSKLKPSILLLGDSHVEQYGPRVVNLYKNGEIQEVGFLTQSGCAPVPNTYRSDDYIARCNIMWSNFSKALANNPIKTIIIGGSFSAYFENNDAVYVNKIGVYKFSQGNIRSQAMNDFVNFIKSLSIKYKVIVLSHTPSSDNFNPYNIIFNNERRPIPLSSTIKQNIFSINNDLDVELRYNVRSSGAIYLSQFESICPENSCRTLTDNSLPKYKDSSHLRSFYVVKEMSILDKHLLK